MLILEQNDGWRVDGTGSATASLWFPKPLWTREHVEGAVEIYKDLSEAYCALEEQYDEAYDKGYEAGQEDAQAERDAAKAVKA